MTRRLRTGDARLVEALYSARRLAKQFELSLASRDLEASLDLQLRVADRFEAAGDAVGGWKVGMTSGRSRDRLGTGFRPHGYVLSSRIFRSGATLDLDRFLNCNIEPELALVLGRTVREEASPSEMRAAVRGVAPAFELIELRLPEGPDADHATLVADGLGNWGMVLGPERPVDQLPEVVTCTVSREGAEVTRQTAGATFDLDDPFLSLARLSASLARRGVALAAGQPVITGSFAHLPVVAPGRWEATFIGLGKVTVAFG